MPYDTNTDIESWLSLWGPRILGAVAVLLIAWLLAKAVQWALAKLIDKVPGAATHNAGRPPKETIGTVNTAEFFVAFFSTGVFLFFTGIDSWQVILGLIQLTR